MNRSLIRHVVLALPLVLAACGSESGSKPAPSAPSVASLLLPADVPDAIGVAEAKKKEKGALVAVVGRVSANQKSRAIFTLVDDALDYCGEGADTMATCPTPWDYCCLQTSAVTNASLVVELRGADGRPVSVKDMGIRPLDLVAVKGTLKADDHGGVYLEAADGWFRRDRPKVPASVKFP